MRGLQVPVNEMVIANNGKFAGGESLSLNIEGVSFMGPQ